MAKYLFQANYTGKGLEGLLKEGGSSRRAAVEKAIQSMGGTMEAFYYTFGHKDVIVLADMPDNASAAGFSLLITGAGGATVSTTVLITPEEIDQATKKTIDYRLPGA